MDDSENKMLNKLREEAEYCDIHLRVEKVPEILKDLSYIHSLWLDFSDKVYLPEWMDDIKIDNLTITGMITRQGRKDIQSSFPNCTFFLACTIIVP
jgi:hypothetical protein